jgi:flagellar operon protein
MNNKIYFPQQPIEPIKPAGSTQKKSASTESGSFEQILDKKLNEIKFSNHARERLKSRNIELDAEELDKLAEAVGKARAKGSKDSLILMNDLALVVSVKNNTVITAVDGGSLKENVFTNIDSAVII